MEHHLPDIDEQPTALADLTIIEEPLPLNDAADQEQPTTLAEWSMETVPLPPWDMADANSPAEAEPAA
jgi:hypothetical protein